MKISLKFLPVGPINIISSIIQIMALRRPGGEPLSEPMTISLLKHICVTRTQWVKRIIQFSFDPSFYIKIEYDYHIENKRYPDSKVHWAYIGPTIACNPPVSHITADAHSPMR